MAQIINTNIFPVVTQNNINRNHSAMSTAIDRLSSGLRISSVKDSAPSQVIANRFTSNIKDLNQAAHNTNDAVLLSQIAEGVLSEINNNLQSMLAKANQVPQQVLSLLQ